MKLAQILENKVHWIFEAEMAPDFASSIVIIDITNNPEVQENWGYDAHTELFIEPVIEVTEEDLLMQLQPTTDDILDAQIEIKILTTLLEIGVI